MGSETVERCRCHASSLRARCHIGRWRAPHSAAAAGPRAEMSCSGELVSGLSNVILPRPGSGSGDDGGDCWSFAAWRVKDPESLSRVRVLG